MKIFNKKVMISQEVRNKNFINFKKNSNNEDNKIENLMIIHMIRILGRDEDHQRLGYF
jgi:hypothetical protein